ncbi:unnamed protein product [Rotaria magnacalcarata]|uniref:Uncharacterized protein n=2 Tax=Rotaria magnacalcarata TaxID=392030 RepID=A0A814VCX7_9BILA|nr:unnamed protein product [Rotaria magnacalcarata]CAF4594276.1 unnamed protein product [Rotaria magnacalcarata]
MLSGSYCLHLSTLVTSCTPGSSWNSTGITIAGVTGVLGTNSTLLSYVNDVGIDIFSNIYVADANNQRIQRFALNATVGQTVAGVVSTIGPTATLFNFPRAIFVLASTLFVSDFYNYRIQKFTYNTSTGVTFAGGNMKISIKINSRLLFTEPLILSWFALLIFSEQTSLIVLQIYVLLKIILLFELAV